MLMQSAFTVKKLAVPEEGIRLRENIFMRGVPNTDLAYVFIKGNVNSSDEIAEFEKDCVGQLYNYLLAYGLTNGICAEIQHWIIEEISAEDLFGDPDAISQLKVVHRYNKEKRKNNIPKLQHAMQSCERIKSAR